MQTALCAEEIKGSHVNFKLFIHHVILEADVCVIYNISTCRKPWFCGNKSWLGLETVMFKLSLQYVGT